MSASSSKSCSWYSKSGSKADVRLQAIWLPCPQEINYSVSVKKPPTTKQTKEINWEKKVRRQKLKAMFSSSSCFWVAVGTCCLSSCGHLSSVSQYQIPSQDCYLPLSPLLLVSILTPAHFLPIPCFPQSLHGETDVQGPLVAGLCKSKLQWRSTRGSSLFLHIIPVCAKRQRQQRREKHRGASPGVWR